MISCNVKYRIYIVSFHPSSTPSSGMYWHPLTIPYLEHTFSMFASLYEHGHLSFKFPDAGQNLHVALQPGCTGAGQVWEPCSDKSLYHTVPIVTWDEWDVSNCGLYVLQLQHHFQPTIGFHDDFKTWSWDLTPPNKRKAGWPLLTNQHMNARSPFQKPMNYSNPIIQYHNIFVQINWVHPPKDPNCSEDGGSLFGQCASWFKPSTHARGNLGGRVSC